MDNICVFASSSSSVAGVYKTAARQLGEDIARKGWGIVFGAGTQGLMGELARQARKSNGCLTGVIPDSLNFPGIVYEECDELIATHTMRERKAIMEQRSFAFIALPGGFGTLEEILEIITLKQLGYHNKPVVIMNINGFYDSLMAQFEETTAQNFAVPETLELFRVCGSSYEAIEYIENYQPDDTYSKTPGLE